MKLYKEASLMMLPTSVKDGKLYSIFPQPKVIADNILTEPLDIDADFDAHGGGVIVDANTFTTAGGSFDGIKATILEVGKKYKLEIKGTTTSNGFTIGNLALSGNEYGSGFGVHYFVAGEPRLWIRQTTAGTTDITTLTIKEVDQVPADFDFSRGADRATRVTEQGLVQPVEIVGSNVITTGDFDSQADVDFWQIATSSGTPRATKTLVNGFMRLTFDLANGSALFKGGTPVPLGRYKVTFRAKGTANSNFRSIGDNNSIQDNPEYAILNPTLSSEFQNYEFVIDLTSTSFRLYLASAQVGDTLDIDDIVILPITEATDLPRLDWSEECPVLLLEPQRTNLVTYSENFSDNTWIKDAAGVALDSVVTSNYAISPEGIKNASRLQLDLNSGTSSNDRARIRADFGNGSTGNQSYTIYVKSNDGVTQNVTFRSLNQVERFEIGSDWQRLEFNTTDDSLYFEFGIYGNTSYNDTADLLIYGAQLEEGSYATSYIPTRGQAATRAFDFFENTNLGDHLGTGDATFFFNFDFDTPTREGSGLFYRIYSGLDNFAIKGINNTNRDMQLFASQSAGNTFVNNITIDSDAFTSHKIAIRTTGSVIEVFYNGTKITDTMTGTDTYAWSQLRVNANNSFLSKTKEITMFAKSLSDNECINLTTI